MCVLNYFGLTDFFCAPTLLPSDLQVVQPHGSMVSVERSEGKFRCRYNRSGHHFVAFSPALARPDPFFWKCTIFSLPTDHWVYLGIIGNLNPSVDSYSDSTSYGWACGNHRLIAGQTHTGADGWSGFQQGEVLYFKFESGTLVMFSEQKNRSFVINDIPLTTTNYIHFNFYTTNTEIVLEPLSRSEMETTPW